MRIITDLVDLQVTTLAVRELLFPENQLEEFFPTVARETVDYRLASTDRFNEATLVRAFDAPSPIIGGPASVVIQGGLPAISAMRVITETDAIRARRLAGVANADEIEDTVTSALAQTTKAVQNKYELLRGLALSTHMVTINENGYQQTADFDVPAAQRPTRAVVWTNPAADIVGELFTWGSVFSDAAGEEAAYILTSKTVLYNMLRNTAVRTLVSPTAAPSVITPGQLNQVLNAYGLPEIRTYERKIDTGARDVDGRPVRARVIPEDKLIFLPADGLGETQLGITAQATLLTERGVLDGGNAPGLVTVTFENEDPVYKAGLTASIGLPVIQRPEAIVTATVL